MATACSRARLKRLLLRGSGLRFGRAAADQTVLVNVLISSAGRRVSLLRIFQRALGRAERRGTVFAADASPAAPCAFLTEGFFCVPRCGDSAYIPTLLDLCRRESIGLVVPTIDTELTYLARSRDSFEQAGGSVAVSSLETVERCADKAASHDWLESERRWN